MTQNIYNVNFSSAQGMAKIFDTTVWNFPTVRWYMYMYMYMYIHVQCMCIKFLVLNIIFNDIYIHVHVVVVVTVVIISVCFKVNDQLCQWPWGSCLEGIFLCITNVLSSCCTIHSSSSIFPSWFHNRNENQNCCNSSCL